MASTNTSDWLGFSSLEYLDHSYSPVHGYLSLALCVIGIIVNVLIIVVLFHKDMKTPVNRLLQAIGQWLYLGHLDYLSETRAIFHVIVRQIYFFSWLQLGGDDVIQLLCSPLLYHPWTLREPGEEHAARCYIPTLSRSHNHGNAHLLRVADYRSCAIPVPIPQSQIQ